MEVELLQKCKSEIVVTKKLLAMTPNEKTKAFTIALDVIRDKRKVSKKLSMQDWRDALPFLNLELREDYSHNGQAYEYLVVGIEIDYIVAQFLKLLEWDKNRTSTEGQIFTLQRKIANKQFSNTRDVNVIRITWEGYVGDGKHRYTLIVDYDETCSIYGEIRFGVDPENTKAYDQAKQRTTSNQITIYENIIDFGNKPISTICRNLDLVCNQTLQKGSQLAQDVIDFCTVFADALEKVSKFESLSKLKSSLIPFLVIGYFSYPKETKEFWKLVSNKTGYEKPSPAWTVVDLLSSPAWKGCSGDASIRQVGILISNLKNYIEKSDKGVKSPNVKALSFFLDKGIKDHKIDLTSIQVRRVFRQRRRLYPD